MRLLLQAALVKEKLPPVQELAAAGEDPAGPVGRWFSANLDLKAVIAVLGFAFMLGGGYVAIQVSTARLESKLDSQQKQIDKTNETLSKLFSRFNEEVVGRKEYEDAATAVSTRFSGVEAQQQALYTIMLNRALSTAGAAPR